MASGDVEPAVPFAHLVPSATETDTEMDDQSDYKEFMDTSEGKKIVFVNRNLGPHPLKTLRRILGVRQRKTSNGAMRFSVNPPPQQQISFQELLQNQMPDPKTIKLPKIKKKVQAAIRALMKAQSACAAAEMLSLPSKEAGAVVLPPEED